MYVPIHYVERPPRTGLTGTDTRASSLVETEVQWQTPPARSAALNPAVSQVRLTRWKGDAKATPLEISTDHVEATHFLSYCLRATKERYWIGTDQFVSGTLLPGRVFMQAPTSRRRYAIVHGAFDVFRIYFPQALLAECFEEAHGKRPDSDLILFDPHFTEDKTICELTRALVDVDEHGGPLGSSFVEGVGRALAFHLVARYPNQRGSGGRDPAPLAKWRLKRVTDYVEENLSQPLHLADLSAAAGLSRMHFAAQFRAATGRTPHTYIMQSRITQAKQMLVDDNASVADVAQKVGFRTHAHFTSVFKKAVGLSPVHWKNDVLR
jgi:AraC-like DNA-binding protein